MNYKYVIAFLGTQQQKMWSKSTSGWVLAKADSEKKFTPEFLDVKGLDGTMDFVECIRFISFESIPLDTFKATDRGGFNFYPKGGVSSSWKLWYHAGLNLYFIIIPNGSDWPKHEEPMKEWIEGLPAESVDKLLALNSVRIPISMIGTDI